VSQTWMDIFRQSHDADLGQALRRLARQAVAMHLAQRGEHPAEPGAAAPVPIPAGRSHAAPPPDADRPLRERRLRAMAVRIQPVHTGVIR